MYAHLSAAAAGGASNIPALITAGAGLAGVIVGQLTVFWQQARTRRGEANKQTEAVTAELVAAVTQLQQTLQVLAVRWNSGRVRGVVLGTALFEMIVGRVTGEVGPAALRALHGAADFDERAGTAIAGELSAPTARVVTALSRAVLLPDQAIVNAAVAVSEALPAVGAAYADNQIIRSRAKAAAAAALREQADTALQEALGELITATRARLHPPPRRWWPRRLTSPRRRRVIAAVLAQRTADNPTVIAPASSPPALPAATN